MERLQQSSLCSDCILQALPGSEECLEFIRFRPDFAPDRKSVLALPEGEKFLAALALERPARCEALRALLPKPPRGGPNMHHLANCAEVNLVKQLGPRKE